MTSDHFVLEEVSVVDSCAPAVPVANLETAEQAVKLK